MWSKCSFCTEHAATLIVLLATGGSLLARGYGELQSDLDPAGQLHSSSGTGNGGSGVPASDHDSHEAHEYETLAFLFGAMLVGTVVLHLMTHPWLRSLQFTVVLFVLGIFFALIAEVGGLDSVGMLHRSYETWVTIDPHLLLFTILPPLLCGDAMTIDTHIAKGCFRQCLLLAGPGVVIGSFSTAFVLYTVLPYGWDVWMCLTVGSILAATDPVAVVSLLKELGASPVLTMLIQGESLLNDGTAIVLFTIAYDIASGETYDFAMVISFLIKSTLGAACVGGSIGFLSYLWIRSASDKLSHHNPMIQITVTLSCAYWSFILAEGVFKISGVISTVTASVVLAHTMWPAVVKKDAMHEIWHVIEIIGNCVVFFLAGAMTGKAMFEIEATDVLWALLVYVAITIIRGSMLVAFFPLLRRLGRQVSIKDIIVMTWGGLRGMVGLALAILVKTELADGKISKKDGDRVLFLVGSIAMLTLIVNATTSPALCRFLGILQPPDGRQIVIKHVVRSASEYMDKLVKDLAGGRDCKECDIDMVQNSVNRLLETLNHGREDKKGRSQSKQRAGLHRSAQVDELWSDFNTWKHNLLKTQDAVPKFKHGRQLDHMRALLAMKETNEKELQAVRQIFLEAASVSYWQQIKKGRFTTHTGPQILLNSVKIAKDRVGDRLCDWEVLEPDIDFQTKEVLAENGELKRQAISIVKRYNWSRSSLTDITDSLRRSAGSLSHKIAVATGDFTQYHCCGGSRLRLVNRFRQWREAYEMRRACQKQMKAVQVIHAFIEAHTHAQDTVAEMNGQNSGLSSKDASPEQAFVVIESQTLVFRAACKRAEIKKSVQTAVTTLWQVKHLSDDLRHHLLGLHEVGVLQKREVEEMLHPLDEGLRRLETDRKQLFRTLANEEKRKTTGGTEANDSKITAFDAALRIQRLFRTRRMKKMVQKTLWMVENHLTLKEVAGDRYESNKSPDDSDSDSSTSDDTAPGENTDVVGEDKKVDTALEQQSSEGSTPSPREPNDWVAQEDMPPGMPLPGELLDVDLEDTKGHATTVRAVPDPLQRPESVCSRLLQ